MLSNRYKFQNLAYKTFMAVQFATQFRMLRHFIDRRDVFLKII